MAATCCGSIGLSWSKADGIATIHSPGERNKIMGRQSTITVNIFILQAFILVGFSAGAAEVEVQGPKSVVVSPIAVHVNDQTNTAVAYGPLLTSTSSSTNTILGQGPQHLRAPCGQ